MKNQDLHHWLNTWGWWIDTEGTVWRANREDGIRRFPVQGLLDEYGNPIYTFATSLFEENPAPFKEDSVSGYKGDINRLLYYPETDTLYLTGYSETDSYSNDFDHWGQLGRVIVRYDAWSTGDREPDWELAPFWSDEGSPIGLDIAADYLFLAYTFPAPAHINIYNVKSGAYVGKLAPNPVVGDRSGWFDIRYPVRAFQRTNGEYIIFAEEDERGKNLMYRWKP